MYFVQYLRNLDGWDKEHKFIIGRLILEFLTVVAEPSCDAEKSAAALEEIKVFIESKNRDDDRWYFVKEEWGPLPKEKEHSCVPKSSYESWSPQANHFDKCAKAIFNGEKKDARYRYSLGHIEEQRPWHGTASVMSPREILS